MLQQRAEPAARAMRTGQSPLGSDTRQFNIAEVSRLSGRRRPVVDHGEVPTPAAAVLHPRAGIRPEPPRLARAPVRHSNELRLCGFDQAVQTGWGCARCGVEARVAGAAVGGMRGAWGAHCAVEHAAPHLRTADQRSSALHFASRLDHSRGQSKLCKQCREGGPGRCRRRRAYGRRQRGSRGR